MPTTNLSETIDFSGQEFFVGLDVHKRSWSVTVRSLNHQVAHFTQPPSAKTLYKTLQTRFTGGKFYSAYEAGSRTLRSTNSKLCEILGLRVFVANCSF